MKAITWAVLFVVVCAICASVFAMDVELTNTHLYNNGTHLNCGGAWTTCERSITGEWVYCSRCGVQRHR